MPGSEKLEYAGLTDVGVRRSHNQDSFALLPATDKEQFRTRGHLFLVADGMGAHAVGELASKLAADAIPHLYCKYAHEGPVAALRRAFTEANATIHTRGQQNREFEGMGTTGTSLVLRPEGAYIGHVGDSRVYRIRAGQIEQLSFDHSLVWEMARRQKVRPEELQGIPSNVIIRSLGPEPLVQIDIEGPHPIQAGDIYVLCSDGLSGPLSDHEIGAVASTLPPQEACRLLIDLANLHGGPDNITAIVVRLLADSSDNAVPGESSGSNPSRPPGKPWYHLLPWPILCLIAGVALALTAILLATYDLPGKMPTFFLAAGALIAGMGGLMFLPHQEEPPDPEPQAPPELRIYRNTPCTLELPLIHKVVKAIAALEEWIRSNGGTADWDTLRQRVKQGELYLQREQLPEAFREFSRAMRLLTETIHRLRSREESFQPLWDTRKTS